MTRFKQKLIRGLGAFLLAGALLFPKVQAQERLIIDNFSQQNDTTLNYYGSGDINLDNAINYQDVDRLNSLINKTFSDPLDDRLTDRADINGDEVIDNQDKLDLENYLNENINYLPSNWNKSNTAEKTSWFEKMVEIDETDKISSVLCYEFAIPLAINFHGFESLKDVNPDDFKWKFSKNGRFNIPIYYVNTTTTSGTPHAINGVLIRDNPFDFNHWYFIEPFNDKEINSGDWNMAINNYVKINKLNINEDGTSSTSLIIMWFLDKSGNPTLTYTKPYVVPSNPNKDTIPPEINLSISDSSYFNSSVNLEYLVKENQTFLDSAYYGLNGNKQDIDCELPYTSIISLPVDSISGTIPLASEEGEHNLVFYANDIAKPQGNETILNRYFVIDKTPPTTSDNIPETWQNSDFDVTLTPSDALSGVASTKYCISSTNDCIPDTEYSGPVSISQEDEKYFRYSSTDKAGNIQDIVSKETKLDKTPPEITASINHIEETDSAEIAINVLEANPDYSRYSYNGSDWAYFTSDTLFKEQLNQGENILNVESQDKATNFLEKETTYNFNIVPDAVEKPKTLEDYFKFYPNPVTNIGNFEFSLDKPQNLRFNIYDITGKQLEQRVIKGNLGDNKVSCDFSKYSSQICIYRIEGDKGYVKTGKVFKK